MWCYCGAGRLRSLFCGVVLASFVLLIVRSASGHRRYGCGIGKAAAWTRYPHLSLPGVADPGAAVDHHVGRGAERRSRLLPCRDVHALRSPGRAGDCVGEQSGSLQFYLLSAQLSDGHGGAYEDSSWRGGQASSFWLVVFFVAAGAMRVERLGGAGVYEAFRNFIATDVAKLVELVGEAFTFVFLRITGAEQVVIVSQYTGYEGDVWHGLARIADVGLPIYYTREVLGVAGQADFRAPGAIGAFMLAGGHLGMLAMVMMATALVARAWRYVSQLPGGTPLLAFLSSFVTLSMIEGTLQLSDM